MFDMGGGRGGGEGWWMNRGSDARIDGWIYPDEEIFFNFIYQIIRIDS